MKLDFLGKLGSGAYGEAFRARDEMGRELAVKFFDNLGDETKKVALGEARLLANVASPHVVDVIWVTRQCHPEREELCEALILELVQGRPLSERLRRVIDLRTAAAMGEAILRGVEAFHSEGLVHGDLHQENVLVTEDEQLKLIDPMGALSLEEATNRRSSGSKEGDVLAAVELLGAILDKCPEVPFGKEELFRGESETLHSVAQRWEATIGSGRAALVVMRDGGEFVTDIWRRGKPIQRFDACVLCAGGTPFVLTKRHVPCLLSTYRELVDRETQNDKPREPSFVELFHLVDPRDESVPVELEQMDTLDFRDGLTDVARYIRPAAVTVTRHAIRWDSRQAV